MCHVEHHVEFAAVKCSRIAGHVKDGFEIGAFGRSAGFELLVELAGELTGCSPGFCTDLEAERQIVGAGEIHLEFGLAEVADIVFKIEFERVEGNLEMNRLLGGEGSLGHESGLRDIL